MITFNSLSLGEVCERLCQNKSTLIIYHVRSDADAVGSAFALRELLRLMGIAAICLCDDEVPERLRFLSDDFQGSVVAEEGMSFGHERVISVDSASPSQLGKLFERLHRDIDIMIDHHASGTVYADHYIDPTASATGELIFEIAQKLLKDGRIPEIPPRVIDCIYAAISSDTGGFRYSNVTPKTHMIAARLIQLGARAAEINHKLFSSKSLKQMKAESEASRRLCVSDDGRIASVSIPFDVCERLGLCDEHLDSVIEIPRCVEGVEVAFAIRQSAPNSDFRVSMRSATDFDVASVCREFGGGGHVKAAGCAVSAGSIEQAEQMLMQAIMRKMK
jgi:phosphoesterase RecJ-like protein